MNHDDLEDARTKHYEKSGEELAEGIRSRARKHYGLNDEPNSLTNMAVNASVAIDNALELAERYEELVEATQTGYVVVNHFIDDDTLIYGSIYLSEERAESHSDDVINQMKEEKPNRSEEQLERNITVAWTDIDRGDQKWNVKNS